jgi:hypothetical protein
VVAAAIRVPAADRRRSTRFPFQGIADARRSMKLSSSAAISRIASLKRRIADIEGEGKPLQLAVLAVHCRQARRHSYSAGVSLISFKSEGSSNLSSTSISFEY